MVLKLPHRPKPAVRALLGAAAHSAGVHKRARADAWAALRDRGEQRASNLVRSDCE